MKVGALAAEARAYVRFHDAVLAFFDDPSPGNLEDYLAASRELEQATPPKPRRRGGATSGRSQPRATRKPSRATR